MSGVVFDPITHSDVLKLLQAVDTLKADVATARQEIAAVQTTAAGSVVKSVQRGVIVLSVNDSVKAATISAVDMNKAELRLLGVYQSDPNASNGWAALELTNATTVQARRNSAGGQVGYQVFVSFELTEYY